MLFGEGQTGLFGVERTSRRIEHDGLLTKQIGNQSRAVMIVDAEDLQHAGIRQKRAGPPTIGGAQLMDVLDDRPELHAVACHQTHGPFDRGEMTRRRELVEEIENRGRESLGEGGVQVMSVRLWAISKRSQRE